MAEEITALWQEAEQHLRAFEQLARRTVEEAWLAGDALLRIRQQLPHGAWLPALRKRGIAYTTANRFIRLHQQYPEINQVGDFGSVSAALTSGRSARPRRPASPYLVTLDDLWDWERWGPSAIARRFMEPDELEAFRSAIEGAVRQYVRESGTRADLFNALAWFRLALSCQVDFGPYDNDPGARAETARRDAAYKGSNLYWVTDLEDFLRLTDTDVARLPNPDRPKTLIIDNLHKSEEWILGPLFLFQRIVPDPDTCGVGVRRSPGCLRCRSMCC